MSYKILGTKFNSFDHSHKIKLRVKTSISNDNNMRYTHRRYWVERFNKNDCRKGMYCICSSSFDRRSRKWCATKKGKYFLFAAIGVNQFSEVRKLYVNDTTHYTYIEEYIKEYQWDNIQTTRLGELSYASKKSYDE